MGIVGLGYGYAIVGWRNSVRLPVGTLIEYLFDPQQRRIGKKVNGQLKQGLLYLGQLAPLVEQDSVGNIRSTFVYGTRPNVPEYMIRNGVRYRFVLDQVGSVRLAINVDDGTVAQRIDYDAFGRVTQNTNPGFQPFGYAGGLSDDDTKLVRFGVRDYDPETGRWTARDPVVSGGASSRYVYADNEPLGLYDPSGQWPRLVDVANFAAGFGDAVTFGLTNAIRDLIDANGTVNRCTLAYLGGAVAGIAAQIALGNAYAAAEGEVGTEVVQRAMSRAELEATQSTGLLRGGREGTHYVSDAVNSSAGRARQRLALPQTPEVRVTLEVPSGTFSAPTRVQPNFNMPGGGMERTATGTVRVRILRVDGL